MSYSVHIKTPMLPNMGSMGQNDGLYVATFAGPGGYRYVQLTINAEFVQLGPAELAKLRDVLKHAADHSLAAYPGAS
jgi:hypothetical protein